MGRVNENFNEHVRVDNRMKQQIYSDPNTRVNVTVKTKRSKHPSEDWSSILSDNTDQHHAPHKKLPLKKKPLPKKTVTSKNLHSTAIKKTMPAKDEPDATLKNQSTSSQHKFENRTLKIFLKEMRLAVKDENSTELYKILDDLEYVAANLNGSDERVVTTVKPKDLVDVALYKTEAKKAKDDCLVLKRNYLKLEKKVESLEGMIKSKDLEIKELNSVINPLKRNGNDMLRTLSAKANIEDKVKTMEKKLNVTQQQLAAEKFNNQQMELKCKSAEFEINRLRKMIQDMKAAGLQNFEKMLDNDFMQIETGPNDTLTNEDVTLELSEDKSEKSGVSSHDDDPDSALGSVLESQALASAPVIPEMSFKPLDMSETKDSMGSSWSQSLQEESQHQQSQNTTGSWESQKSQPDLKDGNVSRGVGIDVAQVLNMLRNDEDFKSVYPRTFKGIGTTMHRMIPK